LFSNRDRKQHDWERRWGGIGRSGWKGNHNQDSHTHTHTHTHSRERERERERERVAKIKIRFFSYWFSIKSVGKITSSHQNFTNLFPIKERKNKKYIDTM